VRKAISLGGDTDTMACIAGGIAEAFYAGVPEEIQVEAFLRLDERLSDVIERFLDRYCPS
jgi:ADP-ribosylglycohydrolase